MFIGVSKMSYFGTKMGTIEIFGGKDDVPTESQKMKKKCGDVSVSPQIPFGPHIVGVFTYHRPHNAATVNPHTHTHIHTHTNTHPHLNTSAQTYEHI